MICHSENMNPMNKLGTFHKYGFNTKNKIPWEKRVFPPENVLVQESKIYILEV